MDQEREAGRHLVGREYILHEEVGRGAVAIVYRATSRFGGPVVAAKVLRPELAGDRRVRDLLLHEEEALRDLRHESVVALHDLVVEGGRIILLTEFVDGPNLRRHLADRGGRLPTGEALAVVAQVAGALAAAHAQAVVHLDVKPENLLLVRAGAAPVVRLTDFGVAAVLRGAGRAVLGGTLGYAAPELALGAPVTAAADVFALGVLLVELVTGARPGPRAEVTGLPPELCDLARACLRAEPWDRPAAAGVAAHLRQLLIYSPVEPAQPMPGIPAQRTNRLRSGSEPVAVPPPVPRGRRRAAVALAGTVALAGAVFAGLGAGDRTGAQPEPVTGSPALSPGTAPAVQKAGAAPLETAAQAGRVQAGRVQAGRVQAGRVQAGRVQAGRVQAGRATYAAHLPDGAGTLYLALRDGAAVAYLCDGDRLEVWFRGVADAGQLALTSPSGATLTGAVDGGSATGSVRVRRQTVAFRIPAVHKPSGLYRAGGQVRGAQVKGGWIVLADGTQTGVLTVGGVPAPAPSLDTVAGTADASVTATEVDVETGTGF
ncbi:serine/threonine-protein kinase [Micromonosporaceae bacterium Da 78-11]